MTYRGHVRKGVVVLEGPTVLDEGVEVIVEPIIEGTRVTLADRFRGVIGTVTDLPSDMAENHDKYLHGAKET